MLNYRNAIIEKTATAIARRRAPRNYQIRDKAIYASRMLDTMGPSNDMVIEMIAQEQDTINARVEEILVQYSTY